MLAEVRAMATWRTFELDRGHDVVVDMPDALIVLKAVTVLVSSARPTAAEHPPLVGHTTSLPSSLPAGMGTRRTSARGPPTA